MTELQKLLSIAKAATNGSWDIEFNDEAEDSIRSIGPLSAWEYCFDSYKNLKNDAKFISTFNPERAEQLLLLLKECYKAFHLISEYPEGFYPTNPKKMFSKVTSDDMIKTFETIGLVDQGDRQ